MTHKIERPKEVALRLRRKQLRLKQRLSKPTVNSRRSRVVRDAVGRSEFNYEIIYFLRFLLNESSQSFC